MKSKPKRLAILMADDDPDGCTLAREALEARGPREIKANPDLRRIRVIVFTPSSADEDICRTYDLGADSFVIKPASFDRLVEVMRAPGKYRLEAVELPAEWGHSMEKRIL